MVVVGVLWAFAIYAVPLGLSRVPLAHLGGDQRLYVDIARRWLETGQLYPLQLNGAYQFDSIPQNLYPPNALLLFLPFTVLPALLWWLIPAAILGYALVRWRPRPWGWAVLALAVLWPRTIGAILFGNSDMWISALIAAGLLWGWPAALVFLKPTLAPLALLGARDRWWWAVTGITVALVLVTLPVWLDYITALRNNQGLGWDYSMGSLPFVLAPVAAWLARSRRSVGGTPILAARTGAA